MEMIDLMNEISKGFDESGVMKDQEDVFNFVQEKKIFIKNFLRKQKEEAVEFPREEFADGTDFTKIFGRKLLNKLSQERFGLNFKIFQRKK